MSDPASFELLRKRLSAGAQTLREKTDALNQKRLSIFGRVEPKILARLSARTEHNCVARDLVRVGSMLLFGYQVFIGLKRETTVADVFCLYRLKGHEADADLEPIALQESFLSDARFNADFKELFTYYKSATLEQLRVVGDKLLMLFKTGSQLGDRRVFRFALDAIGHVTYIDNRGERDHVLPPPHDFEWIPVTRDMHVLGRHPHINIADTVFVETVGGDLTIKVENNTESGLGIYSEPVEDKTQSLADAEIAYADLRHQLLLKIKPYRENAWRYLIFNKRLKSVQRCDEIGASCAQLPEDHGIVFAGGFALESGESRRFAELGLDFTGFRLKRTIKAPNGEDVLYVFYEEMSGRYGLLAYNLIDRVIANPLMAHGYARFADGAILLFVPETGEASRLHAMQLWRTPFADIEAVAKTKDTSLLGKLGNPSLVRALAELRQLGQLSDDAKVLGQFERLSKLAQKCSEGFLWLAEPEAGAMLADVQAVAKTARAVLEAFEAQEKAKAGARQVVNAARTEARELLSIIESKLWSKADDFIDAIGKLKRERGKLAQVAELAHVDRNEVNELDAQVQASLRKVGERALRFFADPQAFVALKDGLRTAESDLGKADGTPALKPISQRLDELAESLDGLSELLSSFDEAEPKLRAQLLQNTSLLFADVNRLRAALKAKRDALAEVEQGAEFAAQLKVFEQSVASTLARVDTPETTDEAQAKLLSQLEQLETKFADQSQFAIELQTRREQALEAFAAKREQLSAARERKAQGLKDAIVRVLEGVPRRAAKLTSVAEIHSFFASDTLLERARSMIDSLRAQGFVVAADEYTGKLRSLRESAGRDVRDRVELGQDGNVLKLGKHRFSVASKNLELALRFKDEQISVQLTGTDYERVIENDQLLQYKSVWQQRVPSENDEVYRGEYLAFHCLQQLSQVARSAVDKQLKGHAQNVKSLREQLQQCDGEHFDALQAEIAKIASARPIDDYAIGVHDFDAAKILYALDRFGKNAGSLQTRAQSRVLAWAYVSSLRSEKLDEIKASAHALQWLQQQGGALQIPASWLQQLQTLASSLQIPTHHAHAAALHLVETGAQKFPIRGRAKDLAAELEHKVPKELLSNLRDSLAPLAERVDVLMQLLRNATVSESPDADLLLEAAMSLALPLSLERADVQLQSELAGLRGEHVRIKNQALTVDLAEFIARLSLFSETDAKQYREFNQAKLSLLANERNRLRLDELKARPLAGFVRNRLIDDVYLPLIANNLAKQIGTLDDKRSDRSGLLLLISPPGYGKTTLMEYLAERLGVIFVRINGPTLGHDAVSLDPATAPHRGAAEELEKLNLGLAMGNNVMLYLDDIQHLSPEFLQKFISLSDGTRRIDAVIDGQAQTIDLRGKRFAIVMAGNPYTESGEVFRIPDMLANRADVYNLGDVLSGRDALFADSYVENCLSAHPATATLGDLGRDAVLASMRVAAGNDGDLPTGVSTEAIEVLKRMILVRNALSKINAAYVASAAQDDAYRVEPPFKLQGSYRNMVKLTAQLSALMSDAEIDQLLRDHYRGEAQTLGARAEENLLKLAALLGQASADEKARWNTLVDNYKTLQRQGGKGADGASKVAHTLAEIAGALEKQSGAQQSQASAQQTQANAQLHAMLESLRELAASVKAQNTLHANVRAELETPQSLNEGLLRLARIYEETLLPLVSALHHKTTLDHAMWDSMRQIKTDFDDILKRQRVKK
jgi:hypothetical protein